MEGFKVRCFNCGMVLYETTKKYTCHKPLTGDMLRLLPLYKDWPCYDGSLAVSSTPRFLMFCSACAGYVATPMGGLRFADFPEEPHVVSEERSRMSYGDNEIRRTPSGVALPSYPDITLPTFQEKECEGSRAETPTIDPEALVRKIEKEGSISINDREAKAKNLDDLDTPQGLFKKMGRGK